MVVLSRRPLNQAPVIQLKFYKDTTQDHPRVLCDVSHAYHAGVSSIRSSFESQHVKLAAILNAFSASEISFCIKKIRVTSKDLDEVVTAIKNLAKEFLGALRKVKNNNSESSLERSVLRIEEKSQALLTLIERTEIQVSFRFQDSETNLFCESVY